jgi:hypothetical protein
VLCVRRSASPHFENFVPQTMEKLKKLLGVHVVA